MTGWKAREYTSGGQAGATGWPRGSSSLLVFFSFLFPSFLIGRDSFSISTSCQSDNGGWKFVRICFEKSVYCVLYRGGGLGLRARSRGGSAVFGREENIIGCLSSEIKGENDRRYRIKVLSY